MMKKVKLSSESKPSHSSQIINSHGCCCEHCRENDELKRIAEEQNFHLQRMKIKMEELLRRNWELSSENDELVNDMQSELCENDELLAELSATENRNQALSRRCKILELECDNLQEKLENSQEQDTVDKVVVQSRVDGAQKISDLLKEQVGLKEKVNELTRQRNELNGAVEKLKTEKSNMVKVNIAFEELVLELQESVGRLCIEKVDLRNKLEKLCDTDLILRKESKPIRGLKQKSPSGSVTGGPEVNAHTSGKGRLYLNGAVFPLWKQVSSRSA